jgi:hypothetical protein
MSTGNFKMKSDDQNSEKAETKQVVIMLISGLIFGMLLDGCLSRWPGNSEVWAMWATAFGTVSAVVGALWIATREGRQITKEKYSIAFLTAAGLTFRISVAKRDVHKVRELMAMSASSKPWTTEDEAFKPFLDATERLLSLDIGTRDEQLALIPFPNRTAETLARANDRLRSTIDEFKKMSMNSQIRQISSVRQNAAKAILPVLNDLHAALDHVERQCYLIVHMPRQNGR